MKKQILDGQVLIPQKMSTPTKCDFCHNIPKTNILYPFKFEHSLAFICYHCIDAKRKQSAKEFSDADRLYIGTKTHKCGHGQGVLKKDLGVFHERNGLVKYLKIYHCKKCGAYVMDTKTYEANFSLMKQYNLIDSKTGLKTSKFSTSTISPREKKTIKNEIPDHLQWAAKHPYQGGGCSGK